MSYRDTQNALEEDWFVPAGSRFVHPRSLLWFLLTVGAPLALVIASLVQDIVEPALLYYDPVVAAQASGDCCRSYFGWFSTLGVIMWSVSAAVCGFAAAALSAQHRRPLSSCRFLASAALLTFILAVDDAFLLHEAVLPAMGIDQNLVLASLVVGALAYVWYGRSILLKLQDPLILAACFFLGSSLLLDVVIGSRASVYVVAEDGSKLVGITCWMVFHLRTAFRLTAPGHDT